ncbi:Protein FAM243A [Frankliniella fusca]|uniref:Protein FAM243A n=1 Tax=Frankliniella fusca TaxID=407009 RepID=A0AAE1LQG0_9NEOP|nr:Protein FAM243A [Frankliniella fusca]
MLAQTLAPVQAHACVADCHNARYVVDELAKELGHTVLRLPPYHRELNPIELIWGSLKGCVALNNTKFTMPAVEKLIHRAFESITPELWKSCVQHAARHQAGARGDRNRPHLGSDEDEVAERPWVPDNDRIFEQRLEEETVDEQEEALAEPLVEFPDFLS